jgi:hypothetical protein
MIRRARLKAPLPYLLPYLLPFPPALPAGPSGPAALRKNPGSRLGSIPQMEAYKKRSFRNQ